MGGIGPVGWIQIDCADPIAQAGFWSEILGLPMDKVLGDPPHYAGLLAAAPDHPQISFQRVAEPKTMKNRIHLDIPVADVEAATRRVVGLGGGRLDDPDYHEYGFSWRRMADPEGNEFCMVFEDPGRDPLDGDVRSSPP